MSDEELYNLDIIKKDDEINILDIDIIMDKINIKQDIYDYFNSKNDFSPIQEILDMIIESNIELLEIYFDEINHTDCLAYIYCVLYKNSKTIKLLRKKMFLLILTL